MPSFFPVIGFVIYWTTALAIVASTLGGDQIIVTYRDICSGIGT